MRLTSRDFDDIQAHIDLTKETLAARGLTLHVDNDMVRFIDYLGDQPASHGVPTTHNPAITHLHPGNSFWVYVAEAATGRIVACHGQRLLETDDFIEDCMAQTYFMDRIPRLDRTPFRLYPEAAAVRIHGRVLLGGGLYIHPNWRARGLLIFNRCSRSVALRHFRGDYLVGTLRNTPNRQGMATGGAAYAHWVPCIKGGLPGNPRARDVIMAWSSRDEWLATIRRDLESRGDDRQIQAPLGIRPFQTGGEAASGSPC
jgi:hypothetical protein